MVELVNVESEKCDMNEPEIQLTGELRSLAAELDELGSEEVGRAAPCPPPGIPDFHIKSLLGRGGMGTVYLAEQVSLGREVALKVVQQTSKTPQTLPNEARTVAQLHHPNIVQVYAAGTAQNQSWFAMELMRGKTANHSPFASTEDVARLGIQIAEALAYAHRCGVIHRDVKPSNIFIGENGIAKLGDFGLAAVATSTALTYGGTRRYMAPELLGGPRPSAVSAGAPAVSSATVASESSDQYALGMTLQELVGRVVPNAPDFAAICAKATAQDPSQRYENMDAMLDDLRRFLAHKPVAANPPSLFRRFRLFANRNPLAASGIVAASILLAAFVAALAVGYIKTSRALTPTEREAASAAQSLAMVITDINRADSDKRDAEITRALTAAEHLAERFPENAEIADAVDRLKAARDAHARFLERRGGSMNLQHRFRRPVVRPTPRRDP